ncbi:MAG TPA: cobalamin-binding protein [Chloroflexota bacterium]|nr:cobalamin-binding protein [Chloroflexota bacterium]
MRICSLLPSATEIVCTLGLFEDLVGVTHECDFPPEVAALPAVTSSVMETGDMASRDIDQAIREALRNLSTIYRLDRPLLERLKPDLILTQELCEVCAVSFDRVQQAAADLLPETEVLSLEPQALDGILDTINEVGGRCGAEEAAQRVVGEFQARIDPVSRRFEQSGLRRPRVAMIEWLDPVFLGGHWVPDMVAAAGGEDVLGEPGARSRQVEWPEVAQTEPEVIVLMPCGMSLDRTVDEFRRTILPELWDDMPAVHSGQVYAVDGSSYFNRPGPRVIDGIEILGRILHPSLFGPPHPSEAQRLALGPASVARRNRR